MGDLAETGAVRRDRADLADPARGREDKGDSAGGPRKRRTRLLRAKRTGRGHTQCDYDRDERTNDLHLKP